MFLLLLQIKCDDEKDIEFEEGLIKKTFDDNTMAIHILNIEDQLSCDTFEKDTKSKDATYNVRKDNKFDIFKMIDLYFKIMISEEQKQFETEK